MVWFKHGTLALYGTIYLLSLAVDYRAHSLCAYCRILLYLSVHRRTFLVVTQLRQDRRPIEVVVVVVMVQEGSCNGVACVYYLYMMSLV